MKRIYSLILVCLWAGVALAVDAEHATGETSQNLFSGTFADALWSVVAFVVLVLVLGKVAWRPLLETLNARQQQIESQLTSSERSRKEAEQMLDEYKQQGMAIVKQATEQSREQQQQALARTEQEIAAMKQRALEEIENARSTAMNELWEKAGDLTLQLGTQLMGRAVTSEDNQRFLDEAVTRMRQEEESGHA
jgi:F-type H+-transporting ATPase subunit b